MKTVLIADDEPNMRRLIAATIESDEYRIFEAEDGGRAWEMILEHRPDLALLDVTMPGKTGIEIARSIRETPSAAGTRVILLTARTGEADRASGLAAGARYLTKPFSPLQLLDVIDETLRSAGTG